jgi:peptidyl-prolyl cis-trans isomerase SurA
MLAPSILLAAALSAPAAGAPAKAPAAGQAASAAPAAPTGRVLNRVAAVVNGDVVTLLDLEERAGQELRRADAEPPGPARERLRARALRTALDGLVADKLFAAQAASLGVEITDAEVDQTIDEIKRRNGLDDARLDAALGEQGMDRASYRKALKRDLESARIVSLRVRSRVKVTDEDVKNYWQTHPREFQQGEEVRVRHVFVAGDDARARGLAERALKRIRAGEDFAAVARDLSQAPSASEGGDLGWLRRGTVQPELERVALALQPGQVSDLVRTRAGYQILRVEERRGGGLRPLEEVKEEIRDRLANEQVESYRAQYVTELRKDAVIDVRVPELKDAPPGA